MGAALAEVELDTLLGEHTIRKLFIVHENGNSLNEAIDLDKLRELFYRELVGALWKT